MNTKNIKRFLKGGFVGILILIIYEILIILYATQIQITGILLAWFPFYILGGILVEDILFGIIITLTLIFIFGGISNLMVFKLRTKK